MTNYEGRPTPQEKGVEEFKKYEPAIRKFFAEYWSNKREEVRMNYGFDFDTSAPRPKDIEAIQSENFEITNFSTAPTDDPKKLSFAFYVGDTEFHLSGKAADRIYELTEETTTERETKLDDSLPSGEDQKNYLNQTREWERLDNRLGEPRVEEHNIYLKEIIAWVAEKYKNNPEGFAFFEAGCGHGNDFRVLKKKLQEIIGEQGRFLGVDFSEAEIERGLEFYHEKKQENTTEARNSFAQGDLRNLKEVKTFNPETNDFSKSEKLADNSFDLIYMEAVLHGLGHGEGTYEGKKNAAQKALNELFRICKSGGRFFGRANAFDEKAISKEEQFELLRANNDWRFTSEVEELKEMLTQAGFRIIETSIIPHPGSEKDPSKKNRLKFTFMVEKP